MKYITDNSDNITINFKLTLIIWYDNFGSGKITQINYWKRHDFLDAKEQVI